jgi:hypothetical protein
VAGNDQQQSIVLKRLTGKLDIIIEDALLANAAKFDCKYIGAINGIKFSTGAP